MARKRAMAEPSGYTILVIDDQEETLLSVRLLLEREGHDVLTASKGQEGLALFRHHTVHLVIVDYFMPHMSGEVVVQAIRQLDEDVQILLQTGYSGEKPPREMMRALDIQGYHDKTDGPDQLLLWVEVALKAVAQLKKMRETEQLKAQILAREQLKDDLVAAVSHELRTPLTSLRGFAELMLNRVFPPEKQRQFLAIIHTEAVRLTELINDFLDLQRMEVGRQVYRFASVALVPLLHETLTVFTREDGKHLLRLEAPDALPPVWADTDRIRQVLANLLSNAMKFSPHGGEVWVGARQEGAQVVVWVADQGVGMTMDSMQKLFTKFYRVDNTETRHVGGTGLGLALVKQIVEAHQGRVWVESELGVGSTFFFALSVTDPQAVKSEGEQGAMTLHPLPALTHVSTVYT
ncbi:MAG: response regulator [Deltaproteobacteria bacterium]|nr:response regulator [Deltaproteobacteria bacterium]